MKELTKTKFCDIYRNSSNYDYTYAGTLFIDPVHLERFSPRLIISEFDKALHKRFEDNFKPFESEYYFHKVCNLGFEVHFFFKNCNLEKFMTFGLKGKDYIKYTLELWTRGLSLLYRFSDYKLYKQKEGF